MQRLAQTEVLKASAAATAVTTLAGWLRFEFWPERLLPVWYLLLTLAFAAFVLWAFVFAWYGPNLGREPWLPPKQPAFWGIATTAGLVLAALLRVFADPAFKERSPAEYPADLETWLGLTAFSLTFNQLFLVFAPAALFLRLLRKPWVAIVLTVALGVFVLSIKVAGSAQPPPSSLLLSLICGRILIGGLSVWFFLKGGLPLAWWFGLLLQSRHLADVLGRAAAASAG